MRTPIAMIAENGVLRGAFERWEEACEEAVGSGEAKSVKEAEDSRSVTAEMGLEGLLEDSICEDVYILGGRNQSAMQADLQKGSEETFAPQKAIRSCQVHLEPPDSLPLRQKPTVICAHRLREPR